MARSAGPQAARGARRGPPPTPTPWSGDEPSVNYNRILLSDVLAAAKSVQDTILNPREWYERHGIDLHTGCRITALDLSRCEVVTDAGDRYGYDRLLLATGSNPFLPRMTGLGKRGVFTFRNIDDTEGMIRWSAAHTRAVVVGGGLLGLEAARGLTNRGMVVTVVHLMGHLMEQQLDAGAGALLRRRIERMGISVRLGSTVEDILGGETVEAVRLSTGEILEAELVPVTARIRPNVQLAP